MNDTKERLVQASAALFQRQGLAATGIKQILTDAHAPFSSLYHYFPGGKEELASTVVRSAGAGYLALVEAVWDAEPEVIGSVTAIFAGAVATLEQTDFAVACPIATVALEVASTNERLRIATAEIFESWVSAGISRLTTAGVSAELARPLALSVISLLEGALILSQAARNTEALRSAGAVAALAVRDALD